MTEQTASPIGTVAQEAARLIEDMATMARLSYTSGDHPSRHPAGSPQEPVSPDGQAEAATKHDRDLLDHQAHDHQTHDHQTQASAATDQPAQGVCSQCGADRDGAASDSLPSNCRLCPVCRGIGLLRSVRPETVDMLADLAMSMAAGLREIAQWSRASDPASSAAPTSGGPGDPDRVPVQDIPVDDESEA
jgi:hypothetical protein